MPKKNFLKRKKPQIPEAFRGADPEYPGKPQTAG